MAVVEIPSTTSEIAAVEHAIAISAEADRGPLLRGFIESMIDLVFETAALCRFEQDAAALRAAGTSLTADRLAELWRVRVEPYFGSADRTRRLDRSGRTRTAPASTTTSTRSRSCAASAWPRCAAPTRRASATRYAEMLRAGGSLPPAGLLAICGLDLADPRLWELGLDEIDRLCGEAW